MTKVKESIIGEGKTKRQENLNIRNEKRDQTDNNICEMQIEADI